MTDASTAATVPGMPRWPGRRAEHRRARGRAEARGSSRALIATLVSSAAWLAGCAAAPPARRPAPTAAAAAGDFSALMPAPFGTAFKDVPFPLTEVLVFRSADARPASEYADCFRPSVVVSFLGRAPADHLLCFEHDRLKRIEASVALPAAEAPALFAAACADWRRGNPATALEPDACEGRQADIAFSARRTQAPDADTVTVSITLVAVSPP